MKTLVISADDSVPGSSSINSGNNNEINNKDCGLLPTSITKGNAEFHLEVSENKDVLVCFTFQIHRPHFIPSTDLFSLRSPS